MTQPHPTDGDPTAPAPGTAATPTATGGSGDTPGAEATGGAASTAQDGQEPTSGTGGHPTPTEPAKQPQEGAGDVQGADADTTPDTDGEDKRIKKANDEAARYRRQLRDAEKSISEMKAKQDELIAGLAKLAGVSPDGDGGTEVDPEEALARAIAERDKAQAELRRTRVESDIMARASRPDSGVNARILLPLLRGEGKLDALDPTADDYASQVDALVDEAKADWPEVRTQAVPPSSGQAPNPTKHTSGQKLTADDLQRMFAEGKHAEINRAFAEGRFRLDQ